MNTDFYYEIGHSHMVCEDYALSGLTNYGLGYAIVSDGCSSSENVDVGSRILAHSVEKLLFSNKDFDIEDIRTFDFFTPFLYSASNVVENIGLKKTCLDCTLLLTLSNGKVTRVFMYGDGCIIFRRRNGSIEYLHVEYSGGAPYYLSYTLDSKRQNDYFDKFNQKVIVSQGVNRSNSYDVKDSWDITSWTFTDIDFITLTSDGIGTYEKINSDKSSDAIPLERSISNISAYKNFNGLFVERRMRMLRKECKKDNIDHYDDIGVATIFIG